MKIEKISNNQVRVTLNKSDLNAREIKISELAYGSEKAQELFKDMLETAFDEFGFEANNAPLMIEAVPLTGESIMIIVTKVTDPSDIDEKLASFATQKGTRKFVKKDSEVEDTISYSTKDLELPKTKLPTIYAFKSLEHITKLSKQLLSTYDGDNSLYKMTSPSTKYFLVLNDFNLNTPSIDILCEYGQKYNNSNISVAFLNEHSNVMIKNKAIQVLAKYL